MTTQKEQIDAYLRQQIANREAALVRSLAYVGERCINAARNWEAQANPFTDQTGNLRSSVGYVIVQDGQVVQMSDFSVVKGGTEGSGNGKSYAEELAQKYSKRGIALIVVAGMSYAFYVKKRGYDVLDSAELLADKLVPKMLRQLNIE